MTPRLFQPDESGAWCFSTSDASVWALSRRADQPEWNFQVSLGGALLDVRYDMKQVSCTVAEYSPGSEPEGLVSASGEISRPAEKFPRHILVVDDEPLILWSVTESLSDLGFDVEQAVDAESALRKVTATALPFDTVVLDLRLPDMSDLSLLATLRQLLPRAKLILMTAFGTHEVISDANALGASVINKPFELDQLRRLIVGSGIS